MKVNFDTSNWFKDKVFTAIVIVGIFTVLNTVLLCISLCQKCPIHEMVNNFDNQGIHSVMIRR